VYRLTRSRLASLVATATGLASFGRRALRRVLAPFTVLNNGKTGRSSATSITKWARKIAIEIGAALWQARLLVSAADVAITVLAIGRGAFALVVVGEAAHKRGVTSGTLVSTRFLVVAANELAFACFGVAHTLVVGVLAALEVGVGAARRALVNARKTVLAALLGAVTLFGVTLARVDVPSFNALGAIGTHRALVDTLIHFDVTSELALALGGVARARV